MRTRLGEEPAFPNRAIYPAGDERRGITLRQHYAGLAMEGLLADHKDHSDECADGETCSQTVARLAVQHADDLLARLEKTK